MPNADGFCLFCGGDIVDKRDDAKFCSNRHRTEYNLIGPRIEGAAQRALLDIGKINTLVSEHPEFAEQARTVLDTVIDHAKNIKPRKPYQRQSRKLFSPYEPEKTDE